MALAAEEIRRCETVRESSSSRIVRVVYVQRKSVFRLLRSCDCLLVASEASKQTQRHDARFAHVDIWCFYEQCIKAITQDWNVIETKYADYAGDFLDLPLSGDGVSPNLPEQVQSPRHVLARDVSFLILPHIYHMRFVALNLLPGLPDCNGLLCDLKRMSF